MHAPPPHSLTLLLPWRCFDNNKFGSLGNFHVVVNGNWGVWAPLTQCSVTCGTGQRSEQRHCNNPQPQNGGVLCKLSFSSTTARSETRVTACNTNRNCQSTGKRMTSYQARAHSLMDITGSTAPGVALIYRRPDVEIRSDHRSWLDVFSQWPDIWNLEEAVVRSFLFNTSIVFVSTNVLFIHTQ